MREERVKADAKVAATAAQQHGIITFTQLARAGVSSSGVSRRVANGRLHRVHRGIYAVGHRGLSRKGMWMAAVLACGEGAVLSHRSAAELWELLPPASGPIHVTVPASSGGRSKRPGLRIHRSSLPARETTARCHGLPEPEVNVPVGGFTVDFLWREQRLAVETDGYRGRRTADPGCRGRPRGSRRESRGSNLKSCPLRGAPRSMTPRSS